MWRLVCFLALFVLAVDLADIAVGSRPGVLPDYLRWVYWLFSASTVWTGVQVLYYGTER